MAEDPAFPWETKPLVPRRRSPASRPPSRVDEDTATRAVEFGGRITLREAESRFGVPVPRLRSWARSGEINGVMGPGPRGGRMWMVTPESVARHVSRSAAAAVAAPAAPGKTGPTPDGSAMLVPRDAWDRLMDQLGNLHDAGIQLAEARERAARYETEATFLRERLAELRGEREELKQKLDAPPPVANRTSPPTPLAERLREAWRRLVGE